MRVERGGERKRQGGRETGREGEIGTHRETAREKRMKRAREINKVGGKIN